MELSLLIQKMNTLKLVFVAAIAISVGVLILPNAVWVMQEAEKEELSVPAPTASGGSSSVNLSFAEQYGEFMEQVMAELMASDAHGEFSCETCHNSPLTDFAVNVECMDCHGDTGNISDHWIFQECRNCTECHHDTNISSYNDFISAGGFGRDATEFDVGGMAGHQSLIREAERNSQMTGANEACFACHTGINVSVSIPKSKSMSFNAGTKDDDDFSARGGRRESEGKLFEIG